MKKQSLFFWFVAFVCAALIFTGCPQEADDDPEPTAAEKAAAELGAALGSDKATVSGTTVTLTADYTVADGAALVVPAGVKLVVPNAKTFVVEGTLNNSGEIEVANGGEFKLEATGDGTLTGTITVKPGGETYGGLGGTFDGAGYNVVEAGGKAYQSSVLMVGASTDDAVFKLDSGATFSFNNTSYVLQGTGTFKGVAGGYGSGEQASIVGLWINAAQTLTIKADSTLTIAANSILGLGSITDAVTPRVLGETGASIVSTGSIECAGGRAQNFYPSNSTTADAYPSKGTYNWSAAAGGDGKPGWKAQAQAE